MKPISGVKFLLDTDGMLLRVASNNENSLTHSLSQKYPSYKSFVNSDTHTHRSTNFNVLTVVTTD